MEANNIKPKKVYPITAEKRRDYYETFKTKHDEQIHTQLICEVCNFPYSYWNYSRHKKTKRHQRKLIKTE